MFTIIFGLILVALVIVLFFAAGVIGFKPKYEYKTYVDEDGQKIEYVVDHTEESMK